MENRIIKILRAEVKASSESLNQIGRNTKVDPAAICRMMHGGSLRADSADALLKYFGYDITRKKGR